jgi:predicted amino acid racemase
MRELATPRLEISLQKVYENAVAVSRLCQQHGIQLVGITKGCGGLPEVAKALVEGGTAAIGDSRLRNLRRLADSNLNVPRQLIRTPALSQV